MRPSRSLTRKLARLRKLPLLPWAPGAKGHYVRILPAKLTGRRISAPGDPGPGAMPIAQTAAVAGMVRSRPGHRDDHDEFDELDYSRFAERLGECLCTLGQLLDRPGFGAGPATVGAELELFLVDDAGRPLPCNQAIRAAVADARVTLELDHFNLELNATPGLLAGRFAALRGELNLLLDHVAAAAPAAPAGSRSSVFCPP